MIDMPDTLAPYLAPNERVLWQGHNARAKSTSFLRSIGPGLVGMVLALVIAYLIVFVGSPGSSLNIGTGVDSRLEVFLLVLLIFGPFLMLPVWQRLQPGSATLQRSWSVIGFVVILACVMLLAIVLFRSVLSLALLPLLAMGSITALIMADMQQAQTARYVVTNLSAVIVSTGTLRGDQVRIVPLKNLTEIQVVANRDGTGSLLLGANSSGRSGGRVNSPPAFWNIEKPMEVYQLMRKQLDDPTIK